MAALLSAGKSKGPLINPAQCRCCRAIKKCRVITAEYDWMDQKEIYSDMFMDCFGLLLSHLDGDSTECCICATCVVRLREACAFRKQVLESEQVFLNAILHAKDELDKKLLLEVKPEPPGEDDAAADALDDAHDDSDTSEIETKESKRGLKKLALPERERRPRKAKDKDKAVVKKEIIGKMKKLKAKLDAMIDQPVLAAPRKAKSKANAKNEAVTKEVIATMKILRAKFDAMIDQPVPQTKERRLTRKQTKQHLNHDAMALKNAVSIVHHSYVCPFVNRTSMLYCYYCKDQFTNPEELRQHTSTHDPEDFESMIEYNKIPKIDVTRVDCRLCPERIEDIDALKNHISSVHGKTLYPVTNEFLKFKLTMDSIKCVECNEVFPYFDSLMKHMINHFGSHICDQCGACFLEVTSLRSHIKTHSRVEADFPCEICGKNLKSKYSRYLHVATVHEKKPTVNCYKCEESFLSYALRNKHMIEVHGDKRTFPCKLCDKVYNRRKTLVEHNRRNHLKVFRHQCDLCDQRFYLPSRLKEHMATHTGERNYRCEYCDRSYPRLQSLHEHVRSHNHEKKHKCQVCGSGFAQNSTLKNHLKSFHQYDLDASYS